MEQQSISFPCQLPSRGRLYNGKVPGGNITVLPLRGEQEEVLSAAEGEESLKMLRHLTEQLIVLPKDFPFSELLITDWFAATLAIMCTSFAVSTIPLEPTCPKCKESSVQEKSIDALDCVTGDDMGDTYQEPFKVGKRLPVSGAKIEFCLHRMRDLEKIENFAEQYARKRKQGHRVGNPSTTYGLALQIFSINGDPHMADSDKHRWVRDAVWGDLQVIRTEIQTKETGFDLRPEFKCPSCGGGFRVLIPLNFLRLFSPGPGLD